MTHPEIQAFFLGILSSPTPLTKEKAIKALKDGGSDILLSDEKLVALWKRTEESDLDAKLALIKEVPEGLTDKVEMMGKLGDQFLTGLTLTGQSAEDVEDDELGTLLDEMEDHLMLLDDWLAMEGEGSKTEWTQNGKKYADEFQEIWKEMLELIHG